MAKKETGARTLEIMSKARFYNNWLLGKIKPYLRGDILEVGAGSGNFTKPLAKFGKVTAMDPDPSYNNAVYGDIETGKYGFAQRKFDTTVCMNVLEHIKNDRKALKNMFDLLEAGGKLILLVPAHQFAYGEMDKNLGHFRRYTKEGVIKLVKDVGYSVRDARYLNRLGIVGWYINAKILRKEIIPEGQLGIFDKIAKPFLAIEEYLPLPFGLSVLVICEK